jgi:hypothetical protein
VFHRHRDDVEVLAWARAIDAQTGVWLIGGSVREADKVAFIAAEELVFGPVEWDRDVATTIDIGVESPLEVDHKAIEHLASTGQLKFAGGAVGNVAYLGDD